MLPKFLHLELVQEERFARLTEEQILDIENGRNEESTTQQTRVYVKVLKGMFQPFKCKTVYNNG